MPLPPTRAAACFILAFLVVVIGSSLLLYAWRASQVGLGQRFAALSKESLLLANNMLLASACGAVLLGTLYPLVPRRHETWARSPLARPYFDQVFSLLMAPLVFLMGVGPLTRWKRDELPSLGRRLRWAAAVTLVVTGLTGWWAGRVSLGALAGYAMAYWIVAGVLTDIAGRLAPAWRQQGAAARLRAGASALQQIGRAPAGMLLAHLGVAAFILGVTVVRTHESERDVKMFPGDTTEVAGYVFRLVTVAQVDGPNYSAMQGQIAVSRDGHSVALMQPEKRVYRVQTNPMTEAAIESNLSRDLYVALGEQLPDGAWTLRVHHKPLVLWIWLGCLIMAAGGLLAASDRRYRRPTPAAVATPTPVPAGRSTRTAEGSA